MKVLNTRQHIFHSDIGFVVTDVENVEEYDIEDLTNDKAFSKAHELKFQQIASDTDINELQNSRTIKSSYLAEELS